jgi:hypothetical protein
MFRFTFTSRKLSHLTLAALLSASLLAACLSVPAAQAQGKTLQGGVDMQNYLKPSNGPSLNRDFVKQSGDPFSQDSPPSEQFDAPDGSFDNQQQMAPPPPSFGLNASDSGGDYQQAQPGNNQQTPQMGQQQMLQPMQQGHANDPDNSQQMQVQWELWHRRVAEAIFVRFDGVAQRAFANSRPIACHAAYTVTRDKQIVNVRLLQKSNNIVFNSMLLMVLKSMNGNPILEFPPGSRRQFVEKTGTFSRNYGVQGFKFTTGDQETIPNK